MLPNKLSGKLCRMPPDELSEEPSSEPCGEFWQSSSAVPGVRDGHHPSFPWDILDSQPGLHILCCLDGGGKTEAEMYLA
jgi:hypothetical protein